MLLVLAFPALAQEGPITCPATLHVPGSLPVSPGWQALRAQGDTRPLERIAIRHGADAASTAVPQSHYLREEHGERKTIIAGWDLVAARKTVPELWLACAYAGTVTELVRALPETVSNCEFRVDYNADGLRESGVCR